MKHIADMVLMLAIALLLLTLALAFSAYQAAARELYEGQYAQIDPSTRQWFKDQKVPGTQRFCCSEADGSSAEEDIRQGHYWVRFTATQYNEGAAPTKVDSGWMQVPDESVIYNAGNPNGSAIVWWGWQDRLFIRCFVPGAKV